MAPAHAVLVLMQSWHDWDSSLHDRPSPAHLLQTSSNSPALQKILEHTYALESSRAELPTPSLASTASTHWVSLTAVSAELTFVQAATTALRQSAVTEAVYERRGRVLEVVRCGAGRRG